MAAAIYQPLRVENRETRFINLLPAQDPDDSIRCTLQVSSLDNCLPYYALSYVWGSEPAAPSAVIINDVERDVTPNLEAALRQLRASGFTDAPMWIDALCINQDDIPERNEQVRVMGSIYQNAKLVIGWLGPGSQISSLAFETIRSWKRAADNLLSRGDEDVSDLIEGISKDLDLMSEDATEGIVQLSKNKWWQRQWISQEIILADDILLLCGEQQLPWAALRDADACWRRLAEPDVAHLLKNWQQICIGAMRSESFRLFNHMRSSRLAGKPESLQSLLPWFRWCKAHDPRDKLYALLGFASNADLVTPDYGLPVKTIYVEYFTALLRSTNDLDLLRHCFFDESSSTDHLLPSWVPDWSCSAIPTRIPDMDHCAGGKKSKYTFFESLSMLQVRGTTVGTIARTVPAKYLLPPLTPEEEQEYSAWKSLIPDRRHAKYPSGEWWGVRLFRTMYLDLDPTTSEKFDTASSSFFGLLFAACWWFRRYHRVSEMDILDIWFGQEPSFEKVGELNHMTQVWLEKYEPQLLSGTPTNRRHVFATEDGALGSGPENMRQGDVVCVVSGCSVPLVLRRAGPGYVIVGECFMIGVMDGEALQRLEREGLDLEEFDIY